MTTRTASLLLALGLVAGTPLALGEGAPAAPAESRSQGPAPIGGKGPMMGQGGQPGMGPMMGQGGQPGMGPMMGRQGQGGKPGHRMMREKPESYTEESVRKMADGRVFKRSVEQKVGDGSFSHKEVLTNPDGKTATRTMTATLDKARNVWTRKVDGVEFDGGTWTRSREVPAMHGPEGDDDDAPAMLPGKRPAAKGAPGKAN